MVITWYGLSSFRITSGSLSLLTDPFSKSVGLTPVRAQTDIAVISNPENEAYSNVASLGGESIFVINGPGEYDVKGLFIHGIPADGPAIYAIRMEEVTVGFLGALKQKSLSDSQLQELGDIDILLVPVGGKTVCDAEEAVNIVNQVEPQIVIPMHYKQPGLKLSLDSVESFLKEIGSKPKPIDRLTLKKSDLDGEQTSVVVLSPQRK